MTFCMRRRPWRHSFCARRRRWKTAGKGAAVLLLAAALWKTGMILLTQETMREVVQIEKNSVRSWVLPGQEREGVLELFGIRVDWKKGKLEIYHSREETSRQEINGH